MDNSFHKLYVNNMLFSNSPNPEDEVTELIKQGWNITQHSWGEDGDYYAYTSEDKKPITQCPLVQARTA